MPQPQMFPRNTYVRRALGRVPDRVLAEAFGVRQQSIYSLRKQEGVPAHKSGVLPPVTWRDGCVIAVTGEDGKQTTVTIPLVDHLQLAAVFGGPAEVNRLAKKAASQYKPSSGMSRQGYVRTRLARLAERRAA